MKNPFRSIRLFILPLVLFAGLNQEIRAQYKDIQLSVYVNPDYNYRALDLGLNLGATASASSTMVTLQNDRQSRYSTLNSRLNADFRNRINRSNFQGVHFFSFESYATRSYSFDSYSNETTDINKRFRGSLSASGSDRYYFRPRYFIEADPSLSTSFFANKDHSKSYMENGSLAYDEISKNRERGIEGSLALLVGKGRIELVEDAAMAAYILEDLKTLGRVKRAVSQEDVYFLARQITKLRSSRFFDNRIQRIREITVIDSVLEAGGLKSTGDAAFFTSLYDNWQYVNYGTGRASGYRFYAGVVPAWRYFSQSAPAYQYDSTYEDFEYTSKQTRSRYLLSAGYVNQHPVNLKWQRDFEAGLSFGIEDSEETRHILYPVTYEDPYHLNSLYTVVNGSVSASAGYYPTTRSNITGSLRVKSEYRKGDFDQDSSETVKDQSNLSTYLNANVSVNHYFSERLRLNFSFAFTHPILVAETGSTPRDQSYRTTYGNYTVSFNARLLYSLF